MILSIYLLIGITVGIYIIVEHINEFERISIKAIFMHFLLGISVGPLLLIHFLIDTYILSKFKKK